MSAYCATGNQRAGLGVGKFGPLFLIFFAISYFEHAMLINPRRVEHVGADTRQTAFHAAQRAACLA